MPHESGACVAMLLSMRHRCAASLGQPASLLVCSRPLLQLVASPRLGSQQQHPLALQVRVQWHLQSSIEESNRGRPKLTLWPGRETQPVRLVLLDLVFPRCQLRLVTTSLSSLLSLCIKTGEVHRCTRLVSTYRTRRCATAAATPSPESSEMLPSVLAAKRRTVVVALPSSARLPRPTSSACSS